MLISALAVAAVLGKSLSAEELEVRFSGHYAVFNWMGRVKKVDLDNNRDYIPSEALRYNVYAFGKETVSKLSDQVMKECTLTLRGKVLAIATFQSKINIDPECISGLQDSIYSLIDRENALKALIERPQLDTFLRQRRLEMSDLFDAATVKQLGTMVGSDFLLVGTFVLGGRKETFDLNWRLLDCSTGARSKSNVITFKVVK